MINLKEQIYNKIYVKPTFRKAMHLTKEQF